MRIRFTTAGTGHTLLGEHLFVKKIELALIKKQIEVLSTFLPDEILRLGNSELETLQNYVGVLLFVNVYGVTLLTEKYNKIGDGGIYKLTATLNAYLGSMIQIVDCYGGDVLKFCSSTFLVLWKVMPDDNLYEILHDVVVCSLLIQRTIGTFETEVNVELKSKMTISCGNMTFTVIGDETDRNYIVIGDAVNEVKEAVIDGTSGDVIISLGAWSHMLQDRYEYTYSDSGNIKVSNVFYKPNESSKKAYYDQKNSKVQELVDAHIQHRNMLHAKRTFDSNLTDSKITENFIKTIPKRAQIVQATKHWIVDELCPFIIENVQYQVNESQPVEYLTEMREMTMQFFSITPTVAFNDASIIDIVNTAFNLISQIVGELLGVINKITLFEKDILILVLFGLRGQKHERECQNALKSAYEIRQTLYAMDVIKSVSVCVTSGLVYCGVIGHPMRRQYTVIGTPVNRATKLVTVHEDKVTCDYKTFKRSQLSSFYFQMQKVIKIKGFDDLGNILEYNEHFDKAPEVLTDIEPIYGREAEYNLLRAIIMEPESVGDVKGICLLGPAKIGKSAVVASILNSFSKVKPGGIASVGLMNSQEIPYFCASSLYRQLYDHLTQLDSAEIKGLKNLPRELFNIDDETGINEDVALRKYRVLNYFRDICRFNFDSPVLLFIDNIDYIDYQSLEILELTFEREDIRLLVTGEFIEEFTWDVRFKLGEMENFKILEIGPVDDESIPQIACQLLRAGGIPAILASLLTKSCEGRPGYVQLCLLHLINNGSIEMTMYDKKDLKKHKFFFAETEFSTDIIPIIQFSDRYKNDGLTFATISLDLFDSFTPYQQLVIKTASVLGDIFTRVLLIVAMKYPPEMTLAKVVMQLYEEEVFECGSRYVYGYSIEGRRLVCLCYYDEDYFDVNDERDGLPRYAYCKLIHFKNKSIREVSYDLLPANQRTELHLLCTDVLENMASTCPNCLRQPTINYINVYKFKEITDFCNDPNVIYRTPTPESCSGSAIKEVLRRYIMENDEFNPYIERSEVDTNIEATRPVYRRNMCNCYEILTRTYVDLIHHSRLARHLGKFIYFTTQHGLMLLALYDYSNSMNILTRARELCMINAKLPQAQITEGFRIFHINTIEIGLAIACIDLRMLKAAKNHLVIALRQFNVPSLALQYKVFTKLMQRSFLLNSRRMIPVSYGNNFFRRNMGISLAYAAKLFSLEGKWTLARVAASFSMYILKTVNINIPILADMFCTAIEIFRYSNDMQICEKLQKYALKEYQRNFAHSSTFHLHGLHTLLTDIFVLETIKGNLIGATRLGYRVLDLTYKTSYPFTDFKLIHWLSILLMYNYRVPEYVNLLKMIKECSVGPKFNRCQYYVLNLNFYLRTGYSADPIHRIVEFIEKEFAHSTRPSWLENYFVAAMQLYYLRHGKYQQADEWKMKFTFDSYNTRREMVINAVMYVIECKIFLLLRSRRLKNPYLEVEENAILKLLGLFKEQAEKQYHLFMPLYQIYFAWFQKLMKNNWAAKKALRKSVNYSEQQENILYAMFAVKLKNLWAGHYSHTMKEIPSHVDVNRIPKLYSMSELAQFMPEFPLE